MFIFISEWGLWGPSQFRAKIVLVSETVNFENGDIFSYIQRAKGDAEDKFPGEDASGEWLPLPRHIGPRKECNFSETRKYPRNSVD